MQKSNARQTYAKIITDISILSSCQGLLVLIGQICYQMNKTIKIAHVVWCVPNTYF
jgi:hypothetical protein